MKINTLIAVAVGLALSGSVMAKSPEENIRTIIGPNMPEIKEIKKANVGIDGLWEIVTAGGEVFYSNSEGTRLIVGNIWDTQAKTNLTQVAVDKAQKIDFASFDLKSANFVSVQKDEKGKAERKLVLFSDPQCGYCKQFERDVVANLKNATVYTYVVSVLGPNSEAVVKQIGCEPDQKKAYVDYMTKGVVPSNPGLCDAGAKMLEKAKSNTSKYGIRSTPTSYVQSGMPIRGALPLSEVERMMNEK